MNNIYFLLIALFSVSGCVNYNANAFQEPPYVKDVNRVISLHIQRMRNEEQLSLFCEGGQYSQGVRVIDLGYKSTKHATVPEARKQFVKAANSLLDIVNSDENIRASLTDYPFTKKNINLSITFELDPNSHNEVKMVSMFNGCVEYVSFGYSAEPAKVLHEETFEEAVRLAGSN